MEHKYYIDNSQIHGKGAFTGAGFRKGEIIGIGIYFRFRVIPFTTKQFSAFINHSSKPSAYMQYDPKDRIHYIHAISDIPADTEITLNYHHTPFYVRRPKKAWG